MFTGPLSVLSSGLRLFCCIRQKGILVHTPSRAQLGRLLAQVAESSRFCGNNTEAQLVCTFAKAVLWRKRYCARFAEGARRRGSVRGSAVEAWLGLVAS